MKIIIHLLICLIFSISILESNAQDYPLLTEHPGGFKLIDWGVYTHWNCGFTKAETTANYQKIVGITELVRKNPVFTNQKGFECETYVLAINCPGKAGYGIPSELSFGFCDYFSDKGKVSMYKVEPPSWKLQVNHFERFANSGSLSYNTPKPREDIKEGFNYEQWKSAGAKLKGIFFIPGPKEELGNGIDRYGSELIVVYNPDRPPYYLQVKFREIAEGLIEYWRLHPDKYQSEMTSKMMEDEYAKFSEVERDGWAYNTLDERSPLLHISPIPGPQPVVRLNPEYWNKNLPKSAIQLLTFNRLTDTKRYTTEITEHLKHNSNGYSLDRFLEALDINMFPGLVDK